MEKHNIEAIKTTILNMICRETNYGEVHNICFIKNIDRHYKAKAIKFNYKRSIILKPDKCF